jgi:hypothetical protein
MLINLDGSAKLAVAGRLMLPVLRFIAASDRVHMQARAEWSAISVAAVPQTVYTRTYFATFVFSQGAS